MVRKNNFNAAGAIVLGMHDALVSLTGLIAGLAVAMADRYYIILTAIIASITASLSPVCLWGHQIICLFAPVVKNTRL